MTTPLSSRIRSYVEVLAAYPRNYQDFGIDPKAINTPGTPYLGFVAGSCRFFDTLSTGSLSFRSRTAHFARTAISSIAPVIIDAYWNRTTFVETEKGNNLSLAASIESPAGVFSQSVFKGQARGYCRDNEAIVGDLVPVTIAKDTQFWCKMWGLAAAGLLHANRPGNSALGEQFAFGASAFADRTMETTADAADVSNTCTPAALIGVTTSPCVLGDGDSILRGDGDTPDISNDTGLMRCVGATIPYANAGSTGDRVAYWLISYAQRSSLARYTRNVMLNRGTNDINGGASLATLQANKLKEWGIYSAMGKRVFNCTLLPRCTSTDSFATLANQTPVTNFAAGGIKEQFNAWLRDGAPISGGIAVAVGTGGALRAGSAGHPLYAVFDVAAAVQDPSDPTRWRSDGTASKYTSDGVHPVRFGYLAMQAGGAVNTALFI